jgi:hypothetical protein
MGLFRAKVLIFPPVTLAAPNQGFDIDAVHRAAPGNLPSFDDVLKTPWTHAVGVDH